MSITERQPVWDLPILTGYITEHDPFEWMLQFRESAPFWTPHPVYGADGAWIVTRYEHCRQVQRDYRTFTHERIGITSKLEAPLMPSYFDPPYQTKLRSIVLPSLTAEAVDPLESRMRAVCRELIDSFKDRGHCDAIGDFARRYPITIFGELFGLAPQRLEEFRKLAATYLHDKTKAPQAWSAIRAIIQSELEARQHTPRDDMLSAFAHGRIDDEPIDLATATNLASTVFLGGLDTLPSNIGWTLAFLADHHDHRRRIVNDAACVPGAVEEFFRRFPSVTMNPAWATRDVEFHGATIRAGDMVITNIFLANCDGAVFDDPLTIDFDRVNNRHITFAVGPHRCLGSHLARHELAVGLEEWHAAIPDYRVTDRDKITYSSGVAGMNYLRLEWD